MTNMQRIQQEHLSIKLISVIPIKYIPISSGGHNIEVWKPYVGPGFQWLSQQSVETP